jgi:hypothetical protein
MSHSYSMFRNPSIAVTLLAGSIMATGCMDASEPVSVSALSEGSFAGNGATFVSQTVPREMESGHAYQVAVTFQNSGTTIWTPAGNYRLGSQNPTDNWTWLSGGRVNLAAGESIGPGMSKTFKFTVTAPPVANTGDLARSEVPFQWRMLQEGVEWFGDKSPPDSANDPDKSKIEVYPSLSLATNYPPSVAPAPVSNTAYTFANFRGANVLYDSSSWAPPTSAMDAIAAAAVNMKLNYLRFPIALPLNTNAAAQASTLASTKMVLDTAYAYGLKTIIVLTGYNGYNNQCEWRRPFSSVRGNAAQIVSQFASHPGVLAWDLNNEPLWEAYASRYRGQQNCLTTAAQYQDIIDGVHAMYNLVRANDPTNKPTTVGEGKLPWLRFWNDVSSFASPHFYMPKVNLDYDFYRMMAGATVAQEKLEAGSRPLIVGEYGFNIESGGAVADANQQNTAYQYHFAAMNGQGQNVGNMFWLLSTSAEQQPFSVINTDASWKPAATTIATQVVETRDAQFVAQTVPSVMVHGQSYNVSVTMKNTGNATWFLKQYKLGSQNTQDNTTWGFGRVLLNANPIEAVFSNETKTFNFTVTAPSAPGIYNFQWQMLREGVAWFGQKTPNVSITVQ